MISIPILLAIIWIHFICDFVLQTDRMAKQKSSDNLILTGHVIVYSLPFIIIGGFLYAFINGVLHWMVDYISSRVSKKLYAENRIHDFFVVVGLDQVLHLSCLILTYVFLGEVK